MDTGAVRLGGDRMGRTGCQRATATFEDGRPPASPFGRWRGTSKPCRTPTGRRSGGGGTAPPGTSTCTERPPAPSDGWGAAPGGSRATTGCCRIGALGVVDHVAKRERNSRIRHAVRTVLDEQTSRVVSSSGGGRKFRPEIHGGSTPRCPPPRDRVLCGEPRLIKRKQKSTCRIHATS